METKAEVSQRHQQEWLRFRAQFIDPDYSALEEKEAKTAKILADILKIYQEGERKAYGFADGESQDNVLEVQFAE